MIAAPGAVCSKQTTYARALGRNYLGGLQANKAFMDNPDLPGDGSVLAIHASDVRKAV